jgi:hypothetical protein
LTSVFLVLSHFSPEHENAYDYESYGCDPLDDLFRQVLAYARAYCDAYERDQSERKHSAKKDRQWRARLSRQSDGRKLRFISHLRQK